MQTLVTHILERRRTVGWTFGPISSELHVLISLSFPLSLFLSFSLFLCRFSDTHTHLHTFAHSLCLFLCLPSYFSLIQIHRTLDSYYPYREIELLEGGEITCESVLDVLACGGELGHSEILECSPMR